MGLRIVVKAGGRPLKSSLDKIVESLAIHYGKGDEIVFVHGGGDWVTEYSKRMGVEPQFVVSPSGIRSRYTSREELDVYVMVMGGLLNKSIVHSLVSRGVKALGLTGVDLDLVRADRKKRIIVVDERGRKRVMPGGYTGKIVGVKGEVLSKMLEEGIMPVLASLANGDEAPLNVDGDQMAARVAEAVKADLLVLLSDVDGVVLNGSVIGDIRVDEAEDIANKVGYGMNRKILLAAEAVRNGVGKAIICNGTVDDPISNAKRGKGSVIRP